MKTSVLFLAFMLLCSSCVAKIPPHTLQIYDENAYAIARPLLLYDFQKQKIDIEVQPQSSLLNPFYGIAGNQAAKKLYDSLSLSFRFPDQENSGNSLLKDSIAENAEVTMHAYGFTVSQGSELITATILGETDWNNDSINDYILSFRINQKPLNYELNKQKARVELPTREYILLVRNVNASIYRGEILFIHDYIRQSSGIRSQVYKNHKDAKNSIFQDHSAISFEQGQENIVTAPSKKSEKERKQQEEQKKKDEKANENNKGSMTETKLSE